MTHGGLWAPWGGFVVGIVIPVYCSICIHFVGCGVQAAAAADIACSIDVHCCSSVMHAMIIHMQCGTVMWPHGLQADALHSWFAMHVGFATMVFHAALIDVTAVATTVITAVIAVVVAAAAATATTDSM